MKINWESKDMNWAFYFNLSFEAFYLATRIAGIDIEFHIHNLRVEDAEK